MQEYSPTGEFLSQLVSCRMCSVHSVSLLSVKSCRQSVAECQSEPQSSDSQCSPAQGASVK